LPTVLAKAIKRELRIGGQAFVLTIAPDGLKLVRKGKRKGLDLSWAALVSGDAALAVALNASLKLSEEPTARRNLAHPKKQTRKPLKLSERPAVAKAVARSKKQVTRR
jgi:hypothetical protein